MAEKGDPFAEVAREMAEAEPAEPERDRSVRKPAGDWIAPVPEGAPEARARHNFHGQPSQAWAYRDAKGRILSWVCRFDKSDGRKEMLPQTLWQEGGKLVWRWKAPQVPRPLYRLDALASDISAPVLVVEGEKAADAAARLFPAYVAMTWHGGSNAVGKADWSVLANRRVVILPDADEPGRAAAKEVERAATAIGAEGVAVVSLPEGLPEGWDCADPFTDALSSESLGNLMGEALAGASMGAVQLPYGYQLASDGLWFTERKQDSENEVRLSDGFEVLGEARSSDGGDWSVLIAFRDRDGRKKVRVIERARLASEASTVRAELAGDGLFIDPRRGRSERFGAFLAEVGHTKRWTLAERTGWVDAKRFALPGEMIAGCEAEPVYFTGNGAALHYKQLGTIGGWQNGIAARAIGNRLLVFAIALAFAGPLMRVIGLEGGGFHVRGASSSGKTSVAKAAGSVWGGGGPLGFGASWRATANALEGVAYGHSETLLILDELALVDPAEAGGAAYALATGQGKARAKQDGALRRRSEWRVLVLSTGEIGLADHMRSGRRAERTMAGQELRLVDISADAGAGMGAFEQLHGTAGPAQFADAINIAAGKNYGLAGPMFVKRLIAGGVDAQKQSKQLVRDFMAAAQHEGDSGQVHRGALRFAAVAAAGEMAAALGIVPWSAGEAQRAALSLFNRWADGFGRSGLMEERQVIVALRNALQQNQARFGKVPRDRLDDQEDLSLSARTGEARSLISLGYVHEINFQPVYLIHEAGWSEILKGFDRKLAAKTLEDAGFLWTDAGDRHKKKVRVGGQLRPFFVIRAEILAYDEETGTVEPSANSETQDFSETERWSAFDD